MRMSDNQHYQLVLVCVNERDNGGECCGQKGSLDFYQKLKAAVKAAHKNARVSRTGCLGNCQSGITVVLQPKNIYLGEVVEEDIDKIVQMLY